MTRPHCQVAVQEWTDQLHSNHFQQCGSISHASSNILEHLMVLAKLIVRRFEECDLVPR